MNRSRPQLGRKRLDEADGATSIEYAFLASLIAVVIIVSVQALGLQTRDMLCSPLNALEAIGVEVTANCG